VGITVRVPLASVPLLTDNAVTQQWFRYLNKVSDLANYGTIGATGPISGGGMLVSNPTLTLATNGVTNTYLAQAPAVSFKGNPGATGANVSDMTGATATTLLSPFTAGAQGVAPPSGGGTAHLLRADGTWTNTVTGLFASTALQATTTIATGATTVASLPSAITAGAGARYLVTDALLPSFGVIVAGGGASTVPVYSDGAAWRVG
jgi:hypothetical protein